MKASFNKVVTATTQDELSVSKSNSCTVAVIYSNIFTLSILFSKSRFLAERWS